MPEFSLEIYPAENIMRTMLSQTPNTLGEFLFEEGELAGRRYQYEATVCKNPVCHCERISLNFSMEARGRRRGAPPSVTLEMDIEKREIANFNELRADPNARALANAVASEIRGAEWDQLWRLYWTVKQYWTEHSDLAQVDISFPPDVLDGTMVAYYQVFRFARRVEFAHEQETWIFDDQYCLNPRCRCQHAALSFICVSKQSDNDRLRPTGAVYYDYRQRKIGKRETEGDAQYSLSELLGSLKQARGDLDSLLAERHALLRHLCSRDLKTKARQGRQTIHTTPTSSKTRRNDPCPCGSGRKWKKCCGAVA
jgi:hypothetical protein